MANVKEYLQIFLNARYGKDIRQALHDSIQAINEEVVNYGEIAGAQAQNAKQSAEEAKGYLETVEQSATDANASALLASQSATNAQASEANILQYSTNAQKSESNASKYATNAQASENNASKYSASAQASATNANTYASTATQKALEAKASAESVAEIANTSQYYATMAQNIVENIADSIVCEAKGGVVSVTDSSDKKVQKITLYGKCIQEGIPTFDAPINIENVENGGVNVSGVNLLNLHDKPFSNSSSDYFVSEDGYEITVSGTKGWASVVYLLPDMLKGKTIYISIDSCVLHTNTGIQLIVKNQDDSVVYRSINNDNCVKKTLVINIPEDAKEVKVNFLCNNSSTPIDEPQTVSCKGLNISLINTSEWAQYVGLQSADVTLPDGLRGIAVNSNGNYTDTNEQQWICDTLEVFADGSGKLTQRIKKYLLGTDNLSVSTEFTTTLGARRRFNLEKLNVLRTSDATDGSASMCTHFPLSTKGGTWQFPYCYTINNVDNNSCCYVSLKGTETKEEIDAFFAENDVYIYATLSTPIVTELSSEQVQDFLQLHTYKTKTIVSTDDFCDVGMTYIADTKTYIDNKFTELANAIVATGADAIE